MKRLILLAAFFALAPAAKADLTHRIQSSIQLQVGGAMTTAERIGSSFSMSGSGVSTTDGTTAGTISTGSITDGVYDPGNIAVTQDTSGNAFSFSQSYTQADTVPTTAVTTGETPNFGSLQSTTAGTAGSLAGTISTSGAMALTAGSGNTLAIGQFVTELTID